MQKQQLDPGSWHEELRKCSQQWHQMNTTQRDLYFAQAAEEQALRQAASLEPLPSKVPPADLQGTEAAQHLTRNALKTISRQRCLASYQQFRKAAEWQQVDAGLCNADGALDLDYVDMDMADDDIRHAFEQFAMPAREWKKPDTNTVEIHHNVCHAEFRICKSDARFRLATCFVHGLAQLVSCGALPLELSSFQCGGAEHGFLLKKQIEVLLPAFSVSVSGIQDLYLI